MNRTAITRCTEFCVDLAHQKFQVHGFSSAGEELFRATWTRAQFDRAFDPDVSIDRKGKALARARPGTRVVMEACGTSHYWGRRLRARGYRPKLVPPQFVAKLRVGNKNDGNDAASIHQVDRDVRVHAVPVKTVAQQDLGAVHTVRELLVKQRTQCVNQLRGLLAERGYLERRGSGGLTALLRHIQSNPLSDEITASLLELLGLLGERIKLLDQQLATLDRQLAEVARTLPAARRLDEAFGIGFVTATAILAEFGDNVKRFGDARRFAAALGLTPSEHSSGSKRRLGAITRRGNGYLRKLLVQCANVILNRSAGNDSDLCRLAQRLAGRHKPRNLIVIALANRLARMTFALLRDGSSYRPRRLAAA